MPTEVYIEHETYIARDVPASHKRPASPKAHLPEHNKASRARISEQLTGSGQDSIRPRSTAQSRRHRWRTLRIIGGPPAGPFLWEPIRVLGQGAFGRVFLLRHLGEGKEIAMKVVYHGQPLPITVCKGIVNELRVLEVLHREPQPFINPPETIGGRFAWRSSRDFVHMLMPVCSGGELRERMREVSCECKLRLLAAELVLGIESLHNLGIVHHDLKPENILIDADGHCRIADFGSAMFIPRGKRFFANKTGRALITPSFAAPELIEEFWGPVSGNGYTQSIDWWALGAVLLSVQLSRTSAPEEDYFEFTDASDVADRHRRQIKRLKKLRTRVSFSDSFFDLISCLLHDDSAKRLTFETIKEHSFFHALWDDIAARSDPSLAPFTRNTNSRPSYTDQDEYEKWPPSRPSINEGVTKVHLLNELHRRGLELNVDNSCDIELMQQIIDYGGDVML
ncbi:kinase-like protein [Trametopsis cervina]|nr:kinase-like protein [Trametopsis cervina]